mmetsp:Transcript_23882/g.28883  ORF Transcript_23882/g.28883 Transcript_23882/m.28883 type:complete len:418 (-) Transcript_23882:409-1662(-)|eukprot:CAMPEP_0197852824 /NCGR_PEP_ID=MMETSP1438-20131217/21491_1 /TAXON_ID=1461541 /ORGANISM="Pterosperma sp., Strain CCMP1384" /LENGTH=417 /DNA_ID=CAMNT_0043467017 /DNA_START=117 /DNA_END=1370 /DNA_ORIENTATION=-
MSVAVTYSSVSSSRCSGCATPSSHRRSTVTYSATSAASHQAKFQTLYHRQLQPTRISSFQLKAIRQPRRGYRVQKIRSTAKTVALAPPEQQIVIGDIGGTNARFQLWDVSADGSTNQVFEKILPTSGYETFEAALDEFLQTAGVTGDIAVAAFAVAGPCQNNRCEMTNISWIVDKVLIEDKFSNICDASVLNDFEAVGYGCPAVSEDKLLVLNDVPRQTTSPSVCIGPGTGLGEALITYQGDNFKVWPSEGGHVGLAPRGEVQRALVEYMERTLGEIELEFCCSGQGLQTLYSFLREYRNKPDLPDLEPKDISIKGMSGECPLCDEALNLFIDILGYEASNFGLKALAFGGVYIAGGIPPKIKSKLEQGGLLTAFLQKGTRFGPLRAKMPLYVVLDEMVGLLGAREYALQHMRQLAA